MSYAIISLGGKQYRVSEGQRLLVDRLALEDGASFTPTVLLVGGNGETQVSPESATVTARVVEQCKGPKIRIVKYKQRTGHRKHIGFRSSLTRIQIESIGVGAAPKRARTKAEPVAAAVAEVAAVGFEAPEVAAAKPKRTRAAAPKPDAPTAPEAPKADAPAASEGEAKPKPRTRAKKTTTEEAAE
ncbi:MAG: 50S ribosomal protein L21 [Gaiella sp.]